MGRSEIIPPRGYVVEHEWQQWDCQRGETCIHCGVRIGQGDWDAGYCDKVREDWTVINAYLNFTNRSIVNKEAKGDEVFCIRRFSGETNTKGEIMSNIKHY